MARAILPHCANQPGRLEPGVVTETELDQLLSKPSPELVRAIRTFQSPLVVVGAGGKMGPTLSIMAKRAADEADHALEVIAASRCVSISVEWPPGD